ncbi:MAG: hypothetical protein HRU70_07025 [Phycisphaeraceae bacterium]|nr:MAG: hypothetical protein HRU70_07025 [Phycisphaeraceae bacterium]
MLLTLVTAPLLLWAGDGANPGVPLPCWLPKWTRFNCLGSCGSAYCICPTRIRCMPDTKGGRRLGQLYLSGQITCEEYIGGTGSCNHTEQCDGGSLAVPQLGSCITNNVSSQTCPEKCP